VAQGRSDGCSALREADHEPDIFQVLLMRDALVHRYQSIEFALRSGEQVAIFLAFPATLGNAYDFEPLAENRSTRQSMFSSRSTRKLGGLQGHFQVGDGLFAADSREAIQKLIQRIARRQVL